MAAPRSADKPISGGFNPKAFKKILSLLERNGYVGALQVTKGDSSRYVYFTVGGVRLHATGSIKKVPIGKLLIRYGKIKPSQLKEAMKIQKRTQRRMGEVLTKFMKVVTEETIQEMVRIQVENEIYDLITWEGGVYQFHEKMADNLFEGQIRATTISVDLEQLTEKILRNIDRWTEIREKVPDWRGAYKLTKSGSEELAKGNFSGFWAEFATLLDGRKSLSEIADVGEFGLFETCEAAADLVEKEWIGKIVSGMEEFEEVEDIFQEIQMLEKSAEVATDDELLHFRLAQAYQQTGQKEKAGMTYRRIGEIKLENYRLDEAVDVFEKAIGLNPNDFDAQERLFEIYRRHQPEKTGPQGIRLAEIYKTNRLPNRGKNILLQLIDVSPKNIRARILLAEVYATLEEVKPAVAQYEQIAVLLKEEKKDEARLREIYEKILILDEGHKLARRELRKLYLRGGFEVGRWIRHVVVFLILVACTGAVLYELWGRLEFRDLRSVIGKHVAEGEFDKARAAIREYQKTFFLTSLRPHLEEVLLAIEAKEGTRYNRGIFEESPRFDEILRTGDEALIREGAEKLDGLLADKRLSPGLGNLLSKKQKAYDAFLEGLETVEGHIEKGAYEKAYQELKAVLQTSRNLQPENDLTLEIPLHLHPRTISVFVNGSPWRKDYLLLSLLEPTATRFEQPGYETLSMTLDAASVRWPLEVRLQKQVVWKTYLGGSVSLAPLRAAGALLVPSDNNRLSSVVEESGHVRKSLHLDVAGSLAARPALAGRLIYCSLADGSVAVVDARKMTVVARTSLDGTIVSSPLLIESPGRGLLVALKKGQLAFLREEDDSVEVLADLGAALETDIAFADDVAIIGGGDGKIYAWDLRLGALKWSLDLGSPVAEAPLISKGVVYAATRAGDVWALSFVTGRALQGWPYRSASAFTTRPEVAEDAIYIGSPDKYIYAMDRETGQLAWKLYIGSPVTSVPVLSDTSLYFGTEDGKLRSVDVAERQQRWSFTTGGPVRCRPHITGRRVVFGSDDGFLYALWE
jgi:outer membrane protein assembly factor BamB/tetratricopeptide (TPR) repeat protein